MPLVTCPACGSDDVERDAKASAGGALAIHCLSCDRSFMREPEPICRRCQSKNVASREYQGWGYDEIEEARDRPDGASWSSYDREEFRCLDCNFTWRKSGPAVPFQN
jgi:hypothetical protein